jgi:hypothetical protein
VTFLVERLADLRRHLEHLRAIRPRVSRAVQLETDLSLHNDVLFSLLVVCQAVIDLADSRWPMADSRWPSVGSGRERFAQVARGGRGGRVSEQWPSFQPAVLARCSGRRDPRPMQPVHR